MQRRHSTSSKKGRRSSQISRVSRLSSGVKSAVDKPPSGWGWAIYLNRSLLNEVKGNLLISVGVSVVQRGLQFFIMDPRTHKEAYRMVSFIDACALIADKTLESLENDLGNMDEAVAYDLADEFAGLIELQNSDDDKLSLALSGEETDSESIMLARLAEFKLHPQAALLDTRSMKKASIPVQRVTVVVHGAKELERIGAFGMR